MERDRTQALQLACHLIGLLSPGSVIGHWGEITPIAPLAAWPILSAYHKKRPFSNSRAASLTNGPTWGPE